MIGDPVSRLHNSVSELLLAVDPDCDPAIDEEITPTIAWRPHLVERAYPRAWYYHFDVPDGDSWARRALKAKTVCPALRIGVAATAETLTNEDLLARCVDLDAAIIIIDSRRGRELAKEYYGSVTEYICEERILLSRQSAEHLLTVLLERAQIEPNDQRKGVLLEVLCAALMSQVDGFEPRAKGVSNRSQQMDVLVHNRNVGGALGGSPIVLVEAKNWPKKPVGAPEYNAFVRKIQTRHKRCKLGFLITIGRLARGTTLERRNDARSDELVVLVDGKQLPKIWGGKLSITDAIEKLAIDASFND